MYRMQNNSSFLFFLFFYILLLLLFAKLRDAKFLTSFQYAARILNLLTSLSNFLFCFRSRFLLLMLHCFFFYVSYNTNPSRRSIKNFVNSFASRGHVFFVGLGLCAPTRKGSLAILIYEIYLQAGKFRNRTARRFDPSLTRWSRCPVSAYLDDYSSVPFPSFVYCDNVV